MVSKDVTLSDRERELLGLAFECMKTKPDVSNIRIEHLEANHHSHVLQIDYEKLAAKAGLKGTKSARDSLGPIMKKLMAANAGDDAAATAEDGGEGTPKSKKKATPRKRKGGKWLSSDGRRKCMC